MSKRNMIPLVICVFMMVANFFCNFNSSGLQLGVAKYSSGLVLSSNGSSHPLMSRLYFGENEIHDFEQTGLVSALFNLKYVSGFLGAYSLVTLSSRAGDFSSLKKPLDRDLSYNYSYFSKKGAVFHIYDLNVNSSATCFYVKEFEKVRCYGVDRTRAFPPM